MKVVILRHHDHPVEPAIGRIGLPVGGTHVDARLRLLLSGRIDNSHVHTSDGTTVPVPLDGHAGRRPADGWNRPEGELASGI